MFTSMLHADDESQAFPCWDSRGKFFWGIPRNEQLMIVASWVRKHKGNLPTVLSQIPLFPATQTVGQWVAQQKELPVD